MSKIVNAKTLLRSQLRAKRQQVTAIEHKSMSTQLSHHLIEFIKQDKPTHIKGFIPYAGEPNIWDVIHYCWSHSISYIVPKCEVDTKMMSWYSIEHEEQLIKGAYNILEPNPQFCKPFTQEVQHVLVPALAFTSKGERLGYGGGYYDRFYEKASGHVKNWIGIGFDRFLLSSLPTEEHDFKCNLIITNAGVIDYKVEEKEDYNGIYTL